ncbi:MAG: hypothetical protein J0H41_11805 [Rhizobiales bacterium]|nr:hypothetical protein [Hyphomicrobiales bacterium]
MQLDAAAPPPADDYESILAAVMETARGRWFIAEFSRRNRNVETERVLEALSRVERKVAVNASAPLAAHPDMEVIAAIFALGDSDGGVREGLTAELIAAIARDIGATAETSRDHLLTARGALKGVAEGDTHPRLLAALDRSLAAIDAGLANQSDSGRKVEALADIIESVRDRFRRFWSDVGRSSPVAGRATSARHLATAELQEQALVETAWRPAPPAAANAAAMDDQPLPAPTSFEDGLPIEPVAPGARLRLAMVDDSEALRNLAADAAEPDDQRRASDLDRMGYAERYALFAS